MILLPCIFKMLTAPLHVARVKRETFCQSQDRIFVVSKRCREPQLTEDPQMNAPGFMNGVES